MFRITIKHLHESPFFIGVPLIILAIGSIFFGFFAKDLFIGSGTLFLASNIFIDLYHNVIIDTEYIPTFVKLLPFFFYMFWFFVIYFNTFLFLFFFVLLYFFL